MITASITVIVSIVSMLMAGRIAERCAAERSAIATAVNFEIFGRHRLLLARPLDTGGMSAGCAAFLLPHASCRS